MWSGRSKLLLMADAKFQGLALEVSSSWCMEIESSQHSAQLNLNRTTSASTTVTCWKRLQFKGLQNIFERQAEGEGFHYKVGSLLEENNQLCYWLNKKVHAYWRGRLKNVHSLIFYYTAMYKCAWTHCTLAKIAPQEMSGHSKSHTAVQQPVSHTQPHTRENFGNDDMYSTFVHSLQTNNVGSCSFCNISVSSTLRCLNWICLNGRLNFEESLEWPFFFF